MEFDNLPIGWKTLVIFGYVFSIVCVILVIILIIMTSPGTSHLIPWPNIEQATKEELEEFDNFFLEFESSIIKNYEHRNIKSIGDDILLDLLNIEII